MTMQRLLLLLGVSHSTFAFIPSSPPLRSITHNNEPAVSERCHSTANPYCNQKSRRDRVVAAATTSRPPEEKVQDEADGVDPLDYIARQFEAIYNRALGGKPAQLKALFAPGGRWEGLPLADKGGDLQEAIDIIDQGRSFMIDSRLVVTDSKIDRSANKVTLDWQLSGTWPFPYRPRVRAAGSWTFTLKGKEPAQVSLLEERWDHSWWRVALEQASPRGWDIWHLYLTPPAEKPLYRVIKRLPALEIREYYPRIVIELETYDSRPDVRFTEYAWILPDFCFTDELKLQGRARYRETYVTTSPIESCVESVQWAPPADADAEEESGSEVVEAGPAKRIRWLVPVPSHLGFETSSLPTPEMKPNVTVGESGRYVLQPRRLVAVRPFKGLTQTDNYATARRWLLSWVAKEGLKTVRNEVTGKSQVWVAQHNMKAGFNMAGHFCLGIYEQPSYSDWGEISVEIEDPGDLRR